MLKVGQFTSNFITLNVGAPQGCVLTPCYTLSTHTTACPHTAPLLLSILRMILWFWASLTTMMRPHTWMRWRDSHHGARTTVSLNVSETKELIVDFRKRQQQPYTPLMISGTPVERVSSFKYLGVNISEDLTWTTTFRLRLRKPGKDCTICDS